MVLYIWPIFWFPFRFFYAVSAFSFSRQKGISFFRSLLYGIEAFFHYPKFQWVRKPQLPLTDEEKIQLLKESPKITRVTWPSSFLCPFCRIEIPETLKTIPNEGIAVKVVLFTALSATLVLMSVDIVSFLNVPPARFLVGEWI